MQTQIHLRKFDISSVKSNDLVVIIGKRATGKSVLVQDLLYQHRDLPIGCVISPTESIDGLYGKIVPPPFVHDMYTPEIIANVIERQRNMMQNANDVKDPRAFLVLDNCMYDESWTSDCNIKKLFVNGRCYKLMVLITMSYPLSLPVNLRSNIDYVFILREDVISNRKRIYDCYGGMFPSFDVFCQVIDRITKHDEPHTCLVIANTSTSDRFEDRVFWYKAELHPPFKVGSDSVDLKDEPTDNSMDLKPILEELKHINAGTYDQFLKSKSDALERDVTRRIAGFLDGGEVVKASYQWKSKSSEDIDGVVTGTYKNEPVVVLAEVKLNMQDDNEYCIAISQLNRNLKRWKQLCDLPEPPQPGTREAIDYDELCIARLKTHRVILALGSSLFPDSLDEEICMMMSEFKTLEHLAPLKWLKVVPDRGAISFVCSDWYVTINRFLQQT